MEHEVLKETNSKRYQFLKLAQAVCVANSSRLSVRVIVISRTFFYQLLKKTLNDILSPK